jgi:2-methylisocitrate lyase-like PEP mutase family enzyme
MIGEKKATKSYVDLKVKNIQAAMMTARVELDEIHNKYRQIMSMGSGLRQLLARVESLEELLGLEYIEKYSQPENPYHAPKSEETA